MNSTSNEPEMLGDLGSLLEARETAWLQPLARSWEMIEEDEQGMIKSTNLALSKERKKALDSATVNQSINQSLIIEKGMIRFVCLIVDFSQCMAVTDLKPSRRLLTLTLIQQFLLDFFDANPLSQISAILAHRGIAVKLTELSGHCLEQAATIREKCESLLIAEERQSRVKGGASGITGGDFSLLNSLELARATLVHVPPYASREVVVVTGSLASIDAGDVMSSIAACTSARIVCSVIHVAAEVHVFAELARVTGGKHGVVMNKAHFETLLRSYVPPPPLDAALQEERAGARRWMRMAFPALNVTQHPLLCECHSVFTYQAYTCPQCLSRYCELPTQCTVCSLQLVSAPQLARTYHHLFQTPSYDMISEVEIAELPTRVVAGVRVIRCAACQRGVDIADDILLRCPECRALHCIDCDEFAHTVLHQCPSCQATRKKELKNEEVNQPVPAVVDQSSSARVKMEKDQVSTAMEVG